MCTDGASTNIRCKGSLFAPLVEEHSHPIPFLCIIHRLELAIKESVGKGLLYDIKEYLSQWAINIVVTSVGFQHDVDRLTMMSQR